MREEGKGKREKGGGEEMREKGALGFRR